jgi:adenosine deaminase
VKFASRGLVAVALLLSAGCRAPVSTVPAPTPDEAAAASALEAARNDPSRLLLLLSRMPKGGDLHNHLSGAVYAESFLGWAAADGLCISTAQFVVMSPPCTAPDAVLATQAMRNPAFYGQVIDAWSMRNFDPTRHSGHDQFFDTFGKFGRATVGRTGDMLAEAVSRAADDGASYLELMLTPDGRAVSGLGRAVGWQPDLDQLRERLLAAGLRDSAAVGRAALDSAEARERQVLRCGTPEAAPGCAIVVRYLYQVARAAAPEQVFAQILAGFELTRMDHRVVSFNLVQPEDNPVAMRDFSLHMGMIARLHELYPEVPITLHAGELAEGLVPPEGLRFHIRESVERAHAIRIGHGVDVAHERDADGLLREMAMRGVLVEIALTSNDGILGVRGAEHPFATYLRYGVPMALATDDEGVSRSDLTREFRRAVTEQGADYPTLRMLARNSLEHAFIEGASLWRDGRRFEPVAECAPEAGGLTGVRCSALAQASAKARLQIQLELSLRRFERAQADGTQ